LWSLGYKYSFWQRLNGLKDAQERAEHVLEQIGLKRRRDVTAGLLTYANNGRWRSVLRLLVVQT
jgi:branched-chain amino acid transport system ATP-binding protein